MEQDVAGPRAPFDDSPDARRRGWRLMWEALRPQRKAVWLGVLFGLIWTGAKVSVPTLARLAIDRGIIGDSNRELIRFTVLMVVIGAVQGTSTGLRRYLAIGLAARVETDLRQRLFAHLQRLHFAFHDQAQTGQLMARANSDIQQVQFFLVFIPLFIANAATVLAVAVLLLLSNTTVALLALGSLPLVNVVAKRFSTRIHPSVLALQQELAELSSVVEETVSGIRVVKGFAAEPMQARKLRVEADDVYRQSLAAARIRSRYLPILDFLPAIGLVMVLWYGGHQVLDGHLTIGELVAFNAYVLMLVWPLRMTGMIVAQAQRAVAAAQRIDQVLSTDPAIVDRPGAQPLVRREGAGEVRFEGVRFNYPSLGGRPVLHDLDLQLHPGEAVALVGPTGCGKTTIARLVPRFYDIDAGRITIDGIDVRDVRVRDLRRAVGIVFEETFLFADTVRGNIAFADPEAPDAEVQRAARLAGAHEFILALPEGYDTIIGEHGYSLSGGQRQRVAIARAILADPRVLILDDATSSVDPTKEHEIREALAEVMRGRTTIVIAHRPATIALADRVVLLDGGRIIAEGTHESLLESSARYREVLAQAESQETVTS